MTADTPPINVSRFVDKLPMVTAAFWFIKITATTLGETGGDWASMTMGLGYLTSTLIFFAGFVLLLGLQLATAVHRPLLYWFVIVATSTAGTTLSDYMDRTLGLGYTKGAVILFTVLLGLLAAWRLTVGSVAVDSIKTRKAEIFYWVTILVSNTLGTALGDFLADDSGLGFFGSWLLICGILIIIVACRYLTTLPRVLLFWTAFILTRPFGATFGDLLTKTAGKGGLNLGTGYSSLVLVVILLISIFFSSLVQRQESRVERAR